jgi:hypothetical protein
VKDPYPSAQIGAPDRVPASPGHGKRRTPDIGGGKEADEFHRGIERITPSQVVDTIRALDGPDVDAIVQVGTHCEAPRTGQGVRPLIW